MKKRLPRAVDRTAEDMLAGATALDAADWPETTLHPNSNELAAQTSPPPNAARVDNVIEMAPKPAAASAPEATALHAMPPPVGIDVARRQTLALAVVERHANYSAIGGVIPLPLVNVASVTAIIVRMVKRLSELYGVPYRRDRARAIVIGLAGGAMPAGLSTVTASALFYIVPGSNLVGLAVSSITASACTRRLGKIFVDHFESGATLADFPALKMT
jgi:uncharacterized protein (DUF697 family)